MPENGHTGTGQADDRLNDEIQKLTEERDSYQQAAAIAESNELLLFRKLSGYQENELDELRGEVQMWRKRAGESAREAIEEQENSGAEVS